MTRARQSLILLCSTACLAPQQSPSSTDASHLKKSEHLRAMMGFIEHASSLNRMHHQLDTPLCFIHSDALHNDRAAEVSLCTSARV
jgi:hypothetical protein